MRRFSFDTDLNERTYEPITFVLIDGKRTHIVFNEYDVMDTVKFHGMQIMTDIIADAVKELDKKYNLTDDEKEHYVECFIKKTNEYLNI